MKIDKSELLKVVIAELDQHILRLQEGLAFAKHSKREAPGPMQSRYDTLAIESSWVADGLSKSLVELTEARNLLLALRVAPMVNRISMGAFVGLAIEGDPTVDHYFLLPAGGGVTLKLPDSDIEYSVVTTSAPIARAMMGKSIGELVSLNPKTAPRKIVELL